MRDYLINLRNNKKLSQKELAMILDISEITVRKIESGERNPSFKLAVKYSAFFSTNLKMLFPDIFLHSFDTKCIKKFNDNDER